MRLLEVTYANGMKVPFIISDNPVKLTHTQIGGDDRTVIEDSLEVQGVDINHHIDVTSSIVWTDRGVTTDEAAAGTDNPSESQLESHPERVGRRRRSGISRQQ